MKKSLLKILSISLLSSFALKAQTEKEVQFITDSYKNEAVYKMAEEIKLTGKKQQEEVNRLISEGYPQTITLTNGNTALLTGSYSNGKPIYLTIHNAPEATAVGAAAFHTGGDLGLDINGENMTAFIWDGGFIRQTHNEFNVANKVEQVDAATATSGSNTSTTVRHASHVGGTLVAIGANPTAKGMAPLASLDAYVFDNDITEILDAAQNRGALVSNHSYGADETTYPDELFGAYTTTSYNIDNISNQLPNYLSVHSVGNAGVDNSFNLQPLEGNSSYDKLASRKTTKNALAVATGQNPVYDGNGNVTSFTVNGSSSEGPTDDLRIKPDITGMGVSVFSSISDNDSAYITYSGSSMASPTVAGTLLLVQQYANELFGTPSSPFFFRGYTLRGMALHTAIDDAVIGPDARAGWGLINGKGIQELIANNNNTSFIRQSFLNNTTQTSYSTVVSSDGTEPLKVSVSWYDHVDTAHIRNAGDAANSGPNTLVNDLDLRVEHNGTIYYPWRLTSVSTNANDGDNDRDNFERIDINNPTAGNYVITLTHKGSLTGPSGNFEEYALLVTGASAVSLGNNDFELDNELKIYPNPTRDYINVSFKNAKKDVNLKITDIQGRILINKNHKENNTTFDNKININSLSQGVYNLTINNDGQVISKKIIKQ